MNNNKQQYSKAVSILITCFLSFFASAECVLSQNSDSLNIENIKIDEGIYLLSPEENNANVVLIESGREAALVNSGISDTDIEKLKTYLLNRKIRLKYIFIQSYDDFHSVNLSKLKRSGVKSISPWSYSNGKSFKLGKRTLQTIGTTKGTEKVLCIDIDGQILLSGILFNQKSIKKGAYSDWENFVKSLQDKTYHSIIHSYGKAIDTQSAVRNFFKKQISAIKYKISKKDSVSKINDDIFVFVDIYGPKSNITLVKSGNEASIIDVGARGCFAGGECERDTGKIAFDVKEFMDKNNLILKNVFITHHDWDHVDNIHFFKKENVNVYDYTNSSDNQVITMGDTKLEIIFTEGHKNPREHISVIINDDILVAGDILVQGVTPLILMNNIKDKNTIHKFIDTLETVADNNYAAIIPGHGPVYVSNMLIHSFLRVLYKEKKDREQ